MRVNWCTSVLRGGPARRDGRQCVRTVTREDGRVGLLTVPPREQRPSLKQFGEYAPSTPHIDRHTVLNGSIERVQTVRREQLKA